jgi:methionine synthase I (cobalamin-dependent)
MINDIATRLKDRILILDGAMGTILQNQGMQPGDCPEWFESKILDYWKKYIISMYKQVPILFRPTPLELIVVN